MGSYAEDFRCPLCRSLKSTLLVMTPARTFLRCLDCNIQMPFRPGVSALDVVFAELGSSRLFTVKSNDEKQVVQK